MQGFCMLLLIGKLVAICLGLIKLPFFGTGVSVPVLYSLITVSLFPFQKSSKYMWIVLMKQYNRFLSSFGSISVFLEDISCASAFITSGFWPDGPGAFRFLIGLMESFTSLRVDGSFSDSISSF